MFRNTIRRAKAAVGLTSTVAAVLVLGLPAFSSAGEFAVLSYNVRGLPPQVIEDRTAEIAAIAPLLEDFHTPAGPYAGIDSVVGLQELFDQNYYNTLTNPGTVSYPNITSKDTGGPAGIGDGLNLLSDLAFAGFARTKWEDCFGTLGANGSDCDTNKGFSYAKVTIEEGLTVDVYTLHADAGQDEGSRDARRKNITQLIDAITNTSGEDQAVIVLGDTNSLYTRVGDDNIQDLLDEVGMADVWVELRRGGTVPGAGDRIDADCDTDPSTGNCELVDKVFYRSGGDVALAPMSYAALKDMFSDEGGDLSDHYPIAVTFETAAVVTTTTTTSTTTTTTTGTVCGDVSGDGAVKAGDALMVLQGAVGGPQCDAKPCACDASGDGSVKAGDAQLVLKFAVGQPVEMLCPC